MKGRCWRIYLFSQRRGRSGGGGQRLIKALER